MEQPSVGLFIVGRSAKQCGSRIQLNCGPASSSRSVDVSCPEHLVQYLLTHFVHILRGFQFILLMKPWSSTLAT